MKIIQRKQLQTAYLQPDLLPASDFVSYCKENGLDTDLTELEYFDKQSLLVPALRVRVGVLELRRIFADFNGKGVKEWRHVYTDDLDKFDYEELDPQPYYNRGALIRSMPSLGEVRGFHYGNDGWLDWYIEHNMVCYPSKDGYIPWKTFDGGDSMSTDPKPFEEVGYLMYAKHQLYVFKDIQQRKRIIIKNEALYKTSKAWAEQGTKITEIFTSAITNESIREKVIEYNNFFNLLMDIRKMRIDKNTRFYEAYQKAKKDFGEEVAKQDAVEEAEFYDSEHKEEADGILKSHSFTLSDINNWRYVLLTHGSFNIIGDSKKRRAYVSRLDDALLNDTEDVYNLVNIISWFIDVLGGDGVTAKQLLLREMTAHCQICGKGFEPIRRTQVTCGSPKCKATQQLKHKKEMRRLGKYAG